MRLIEVTRHEVKQGKTVRQRVAEEENIREKVDGNGNRWTKVYFGGGAKPNVELAQKAGLEIGKTGAIAVNEYLQTSDLHIYAIGNCMENCDVVTGSKRRH
jgi:NAD(P)H-nitrite reductase large subunit